MKRQCMHRSFPHLAPGMRQAKVQSERASKLACFTVARLDCTVEKQSSTDFHGLDSFLVASGYDTAGPPGGPETTHPVRLGT